MYHQEGLVKVNIYRLSNKSKKCYQMHVAANQHLYEEVKKTTISVLVKVFLTPSLPFSITSESGFSVQYRGFEPNLFQII